MLRSTRKGINEQVLLQRLVADFSLSLSGDCRAVLARGSTALRLTRDHSPGTREERLRIESSGGTVRYLKGTWRILLPVNNGKFVKLCATSR